MILESKTISKAAKATADILDLFETYGSDTYDGQAITQTSHMIQCAMLAMENISDVPVVIGALLHDIGYLLKYEQTTEAIGLYGAVDHESIGAAYLHINGFSEQVCAIVEYHEEAKRYLMTTDKAFKSKLIPAQLKKIQWQGGAMTPEEAAAFEQQPYFNDIIKVAHWDVEAKEKNALLLPIAYFEKSLTDHLRMQNETVKRSPVCYS